MERPKPTLISTGPWTVAPIFGAETNTGACEPSSVLIVVRSVPTSLPPLSKSRTSTVLSPIASALKSSVKFVSPRASFAFNERVPMLTPFNRSSANAAEAPA